MWLVYITFCSTLRFSAELIRCVYETLIGDLYLAWTIDLLNELSNDSKAKLFF